MVLHKYIVDTGDAKRSCTGPQELQEWLASGRIQATARVCDLATGTWHEAGSLIRKVRARTDTQRCADIENTLCKLKQAAELLVETLKGDRSREELRPSVRRAQREHCEDLEFQNDSDIVSPIDQKTDYSESVVLLLFITHRSAFDTLDARKKHGKIEACIKCLICECQICFSSFWEASRGSFGGHLVPILLREE